MSFLVKAPSVVDYEGWIEDLLTFPSSSTTTHDPHGANLPKLPSFSQAISSPRKPHPSSSSSSSAEGSFTISPVAERRATSSSQSPSRKAPKEDLPAGLALLPKAIEEIRYRNPLSHEEFSVVTELKKDDPLSLKSVSTFSAAYPTADPKAIHGYYGNLELLLGFEEALRKGKKNCDYSSALNKVFVDINHVFPLTIQLKDASLKSFPPGTVIRATPVFTEGEHRDADVKICPVHKVPGGPEHILRCKNKDTRYVEESGEHSRYSLTFPFTGKKTVEHFQFLCYSSCHELKRRRLDVLFTLEVGGRVVGRASFEAKICSYPVRDRTTEELKLNGFKKDQRKERFKKAKMAAPEEMGDEGDDGSDSEITGESQGALSRMGSLVTTSEAGDPNRMFNIKVQGYENYRIVTKILQGLDALKALGQELNDSSTAAMAVDGPLKRLASSSEEFGTSPAKRLRFPSTPKSGEEQKQLVLLTEEQKKVAAWLTELDFGRYLGAFVDADFADLQLIKELTPADLDALNIHPAGHRKKLMLAAKALKRTLDDAGNEQQQLQQQQQGAELQGDITVEQIEEFQKRTIMRRFHSGMQQ